MHALIPGPEIKWWSAWIKYLVLIIAGYLLVPKDLALAPSSGLEGSWMISINLALLRKAQFGLDYIYTYGPLGFLYTRIILGQSKWAMALMDAFILINFVNIFNDYLNTARHQFWFIGFAAVIFTAVLSQHISCVLALFIILLYHCCCLCNQYKRPSSLLSAPLCAALLFFIKLNYGLIAGPLFYLAIVVIVYKNGYKSLVYLVPAIIINLTLLLYLADSLHVNLPGYLLSGIYIIKDYNDAVALEADHGSVYLEGFLVIIALYFLTLPAYIKRYRFDAAEYYMPLVLMLTMYLSFKNGFVRPDGIHMTSAYLTLPFLALIPAIITPDKALQGWYRWLHIIVLAICFLYWKGSYNIFGNSFQGIVKTNYFHQMLKTSAELGTYNNEVPDKDKITHIKSIISGSNIDIYPHMIMYAYAAGFNYRPRPVPQSYQPYDVYLDSINSLKFTGPPDSSPGYLLFANAAIDYRYPFADESITKRAILCYYQPIDTFKLTGFSGDYELAILFKRRDIPLKMQLCNIIQREIRMNEWIGTDSSSMLQYLYADINFSQRGQIRRFLYQSPRLKMLVKYDDGSEAEFSAMVPILKTGILINKQMKDTYDAYVFFSSNGVNSKRLQAVKFYPANAKMFEPNIKITIKSYSITN